MNLNIPLHTCLGTFRYAGEMMGVFWKPLDAEIPNYLVHSLVLKADILLDTCGGSTARRAAHPPSPDGVS